MSEEEKTDGETSPPIDAPLAPYWLPAIVESADDAIVSKTLEGIITSWNRSAERMFGYTADEVIGKSITILIPSELRSEEDHILGKIRRGERVDHFETTRVTKDGRFLDISLTVSPIRSSDGKVIGASKIARDITERKRAEVERRRLLREAEEARAEAETANRAKDQFLAMLSHELRTPLHSIKGWVNMLRQGLLKDEQKERALDVIIRGINIQNALIEDLLDVSRIVSDKISIERHCVSLVSIVSNAIEEFRPAAAENGIAIEAELDSTVDSVVGDGLRLKQIVSNLINNAIKYTPEGGRIIVLMENHGDKAAVIVRDTGIGIPAESIGSIFERFRQGDSSTRREFGGLGLGLTIARYLAELHGGSVTAESEGEGKGATFTLTLPMHEELRQPSGARQPRHPRESSGDQPDAFLADTRLLVVEDDPDSLAMLSIALEQCGAEVTAVDRSSKALDELKRARFDAVISDLGMPVIDGYDLMREIRGSLKLGPQELPAIALSGYASKGDRDRALASGFQVHLAKPFDVSFLPEMIRSLLTEKEN